MINGKKQAIVAEAPAEHAFPFPALESLHIALEGIGFHLSNDASNAFLNGLGKAANIFFGAFKSSQTHAMFDFGPRTRLPRPDLFQRVSQFLCFCGRQGVVRINDAPRLDEHAILLLGERHEIPLLNVEGFEHLPRNDHLAPLAHATDPLFGCD
jgi:hypothetical protein